MLFPLLDLELYENKGKTSQGQTWVCKRDVLASLSFADLYFFEGLLDLPSLKGDAKTSMRETLLVEETDLNHHVICK